MTDAAILFAWRNDPVTRAACRESDALNWPAHSRWLHDSLRSKGRKLFIIERDGDPAALARYDYDEPTEFSFTIAPEFRGKALSLKVLRLAIGAETGPFIAFIKRENTPCQRLVNAAGMIFVRDGELQLWKRDCVSASSSEAQDGRSQICA